MAYWGKNSIPNQKSPPDIIKPSDGVNTFVNAFEIKSSEATESLNTSNTDYPALATRRGTETIYATDYSPIATNGATARAGTQLHVVDGTTWKYYTSGGGTVNVATSLANAKAKFIEFTTAIKKYTIMFNGTQKKAWDGTSVIDLTDAPATNLLTTNDSKLFALKNSTIYTSDLSDITNWTTGDSTIVGLYAMVGYGTAIIAYNDMIIAFSDQTMHIVYGRNKDDLTPTEPIPIGCISDKSLIIHGQTGVLYWMDYNKFMAFTGGLPQDVSQKVTKYLSKINYTYKENICVGQSGDNMYISFPYEDSVTNNMTLEYDTKRGMWYPHDIGYVNFFTIGQDLHGITSGGVVKKINSGLADDTTAIVWSHNMGVLDSMPLKNLKYITDMYAIVDLPVGSTLALSYSTTTDNEDFQTLHTFVADADEQNTRIRIPTTKLQRLNWYRLKISGIGPCNFHYLEIHGRIGN